MKAVPRSSTELSIVQYLSTDPLRADPRNHTIPVVEFLMAGEWVFIIQASWSPHWDTPPFDKLQTRLEMARQLLEVVFFFLTDLILANLTSILSPKGLAFMHENGIGHGVSVFRLSV